MACGEEFTIAHRPALADKEKADRQQTGPQNSGPYLGRGVDTPRCSCSVQYTFPSRCLRSEFVGVAADCAMTRLLGNGALCLIRKEPSLWEVRRKVARDLPQ